MRCRRCGQEIALARRCPYCFAVQPEEEPAPASAGEAATTRARQDGPGPGEGFRGPIAGDAAPPPSLTFWGRLRRFLHYFLDPAVPWTSKALVLGGLLYVLLPLDLVPDLFPLLGWLDDAAVVALVWSFLSQELQRYRPR
ncbi:MAG: DUF1232 domain-containing protein [Bacillota bacterium]|nr:DUF1232 domain-containing protein [Bacillota bacterium]